MAYFAAILRTVKQEVDSSYRLEHLAYLDSLLTQGKIFAKGPFVDGSGGMVIYIADSLIEAKQLAEKDPFIINDVRSLEIHEWKI